MNREKGVAYCGLACCVCGQLVGDYDKCETVDDVMRLLQS